MRSELLTRLRRSSQGMKVGVGAVKAFGIIYCVALLATNARFAVEQNYAGFMITCGVGGEFSRRL
ncbi:hypothetical protein [Bifidobacterium mongoliense]|uniref:hypothetical protein n=1 Tax=Bifidobacterium mongoliense TaxID=518643 RepID=UPI002648C0ED|nr:hypothetical protein [Bifidobacterium mongoliense]MDN6025895.1 hypothetical protein [Bifidobacterium mongoliense]MDN6050993.1 hypothetical protein [Bifidobacterium mongoliense]MDN6719579.1 hypothetical protein [Bifidobacterium mongoliense]